MNKLDALWEYQQAELALARLKREMKSSPSYQKRTKLHNFLAEQQASIEKINADMRAKDGSLAACSSKLDALLKRYDLEKSELDIMENDEESTAAELTEAKKSIEKLLEEINALHKELAEMITWLNQASEAISSAYSKAGRAKKDYDAVRAVCDAEKDAFKPRLDAAEALIAEKRGDVPDELMSKYLALKKNYVNPVAKVANNQCSGCYMMLPSAVVKRVAGKTSIVECENCGRILTV